MKTPKFVRLVPLLLLLTSPRSVGEGFRSDINPALLCYQAFALAPDLSEDDRRHLFATEWRGRALDSRFEELISKYDNQFKLLRQAARSRVPCDWGVDLTQGPDTLLPGLAKAKVAAQTARLRALWHLQYNRQDDARDDLTAAFVLARNVSKDGVVIGALVQFAMENIIANVVAENIFEFKPEILEQLVADFDASPPRSTLQQCMAVEKGSFFDWFVTKVRELQVKSSGNDKTAIVEIRALLARTLGDEGRPDPDFAERVLQAAGGTSAGLLEEFHALEPFYSELTRILGLQYDSYLVASRTFEEKLAKHSNPLAKTFLSIPKARAKEFNTEAKLAMVRAAVAFRRNGGDGLRHVADPFGVGPFQFEPLLVEGTDRGFTLRSKLNTRGFDEVLVFATNIAPPLVVDGQNAGKSLPKESAKK